MRKTMIEVNTGRSGRSWSMNPKGTSTARVYSGRKYYRNRTVWVCDGCAAERRSAWVGIMKAIGVLLLIGVVVDLLS